MDPEKIQTIANAASDIQRWCLQCAIKGRVSQDRQTDIIDASERILSSLRSIVTADQ